MAVARKLSESDSTHFVLVLETAGTQLVGFIGVIQRMTIPSGPPG